jgi:hypothetical protein
MIDNIYYIDESDHPDYPAGWLFQHPHSRPQGDVINVPSNGYRVSLISLGLIEYTSEENLVEKAKEVLKQLKL